MKKDKIVILEIVFSIIIIISIINIITLIFLKFNFKIELTNKNSEASLIVTNILENMNLKSYNDFEKYIEGISSIGISKKIEGNKQIISVLGDICSDKFFGTEIPKGYVINVEIENSNIDFDIQKNINIEAMFPVNGKKEKIEISTILNRENIKECNLPIIEENYFTPLGISIEDYNIIPIKYSHNLNSYVTTTSGDTEWYNYSSKQWAKVLVFSRYGEDLESQFIDSNGVVRNNISYNNWNLDIENYIYVWIPNFSVKDGKTFFRYGTGKNSIKMDFLYSNGKYLYINTISDEIKDISEKCNFNGIYGVWKKFRDEQDEYYKNFSLTKYGPINLH